MKQAFGLILVPLEGFEASSEAPADDKFDHEIVRATGESNANAEIKFPRRRKI